LNAFKGSLTFFTVPTHLKGRINVCCKVDIKMMQEESKFLQTLEASYLAEYGKDYTYSLLKEILNSTCVKPQFKIKVLNHLILKNKLKSIKS